MRRSPFRRTRAELARAQAEDGAAELLVYDEIGFWGITAKQMAEVLGALEADTIHVRINSPGGDVFDGVAIYNALRAHPARIVTHIDGLAASIASVIALAGDEVRIAPNAFFMIHNAWGLTVGDAATHRKMADTLEKITTGAIASTYRAKSGQDAKTIARWMDAETWFAADEAQDAGFVDVVEADPPADAAARLRPFDLSIYEHVPAALHTAPADDELTADEWRELEATLRDEGLSRKDAKTALSGLKKWRQPDGGAPSTPLRDEVRADDPADALASAQSVLASLTVGAIRKERFG